MQTFFCPFYHSSVALFSVVCADKNHFLIEWRKLSGGCWQIYGQSVMDYRCGASSQLPQDWRDCLCKPWDQTSLIRMRVHWKAAGTQHLGGAESESQNEQQPRELEGIVQLVQILGCKMLSVIDAKIWADCKGNVGRDIFASYSVFLTIFHSNLI